MYVKNIQHIKQKIVCNILARSTKHLSGKTHEKEQEFNSSGGGCCKFLCFPLLSLLSPWPGEVKVHFEKPAHLADRYQNGKMLTTSHCHMLGTFVWPIATWFDCLISIYPDIVILSIHSLEPCRRENTKVFKASWCSGPSSFFNIEFYVGQFFIHKPVYVFLL